jgi:hypothetical protein
MYLVFVYLLTYDLLFMSNESERCGRKWLCLILGIIMGYALRDLVGGRKNLIKNGQILASDLKLLSLKYDIRVHSSNEETSKDDYMQLVLSELMKLVM